MFNILIVQHGMRLAWIVCHTCGCKTSCVKFKFVVRTCSDLQFCQFNEKRNKAFFFVELQTVLVFSLRTHFQHADLSNQTTLQQYVCVQIVVSSIMHIQPV